ncbi:LysE family translocator [Sneathiella sp.]|uniref:LysE family translocator n=1 Tax=Sneathiella sp. TaxID=1964365 RepID=UPI00261B0797|nr:LysE family translocator [Sneathiella sp.]MDF2366566.1 LysE family translocator [Sneathiella sp.]
MSIEFLLTTLIVTIAPGTGVLYTLAVGLTDGAKAGIAAAFGCTLGILPSILACMFGVAALLHTSALAFQFLKYAGVAYLLYLAWQTVRNSGNLDLSKNEKSKNYWRIARKGTLINILNPKLTIFFLAFLPQFIPASTNSPTLLIAWHGAVFMAVTFVIFVIYGLFASRIRHYLLGTPKIVRGIQYGIAATFAGLGLKLALTDR